MPNQTLYDNFSQVRQYIDQEKPDLSSYVTKTELSGCSYATTSQIPVIDENLIPNTNNTYTLGNSSNYYKTSYAKNVYVDNTIKFWQASSGELDIDLSGVTKYFFNPDRFAPSTANNHNKLDLGKSDRSWKTTYTQSLYLNGTNIEDRFTYLIWTGTSAEYAALPNYTTYQIYLIEKDAI